MLTSVYQSSPTAVTIIEDAAIKETHHPEPNIDYDASDGKALLVGSHVSLSFMSLHYLYYRAHGCLLLLI